MAKKKPSKLNILAIVITILLTLVVAYSLVITFYNAGYENGGKDMWNYLKDKLGFTTPQSL